MATRKLRRTTEPEVVEPPVFHPVTVTVGVREPSVAYAPAVVAAVKVYRASEDAEVDRRTELLDTLFELVEVERLDAVRLDRELRQQERRLEIAGAVHGAPQDRLAAQMDASALHALTVRVSALETLSPEAALIAERVSRLTSRVAKVEALALKPRRKARRPRGKWPVTR